MLSASNGPDNDKRLLPGHNGVGEWRVGRFVGQILLAREKAQKWAALLCDMVADCASEHRISPFKRVQHRALRYWDGHFECHFTADLGQISQMKGKDDADHMSSFRSSNITRTPDLDGEKTAYTFIMQ
jgi:hypothetical protein